ncbi:MAG: ADP-ribosylglycohydrolase family protein, partial [Bacillota bacterium]
MERIRGAFLGLACGDALGATLEFMSRDEIRRRYPGGHRDLTGGGAFGWAPGEITDDTAMALAVARGIVAAGPDAPVDQLMTSVGQEFVRWAASGPKDIGGTVGLAIRAFRKFGDWEQASAHVRSVLGDRTAGNGALMRTLPVSLFWPDNPERTVVVSRALTRMTHPNPEAEWCSAVYNLYAQALLRGSGKAPGWEGAVATLTAAAPDLQPTAEALGRRMAGAGHLAEEKVRSTGYCVDTLE